MDEETIRDGDNHTLYERFAVPLFEYICQHISNKQDAEDLMVEVFLAAFHNTDLDSLPAKRQLAWLKRVTMHKLIDRYRHLALLRMVPIELASDVEDATPTPEQYAEQQESYEWLYRALEQLQPLQRELLWLRYTKNMNYCEIARVLGKSESAVRKVCSRTIQQLRGISHQLEEGSNDE